MEPLEPRLLLDSHPLITEFMADNALTHQDAAGNSPDWIEICNPTDSAIPLDDYYLTDDSDDLTQWQFPAGETLAAGAYLLVFADNTNDPPVAGTELHANFALSRDGEYLALLYDAPGAMPPVAVSEYTFPQQKTDVSYGVLADYDITTILGAGAEARTLIPGGSVSGWTDIVFNDAGWIQGPNETTGVGAAGEGFFSGREREADFPFTLSALMLSLAFLFGGLLRFLERAFGESFFDMDACLSPGRSGTATGKAGVPKPSPPEPPVDRPSLSLSTSCSATKEGGIMVVHVHCPACGCEFRRPENVVGTVVACPNCGKRLRVRTQRTTAEEEPEPRHCASCGCELPLPWPDEWSLCGKCHHARQQYKREVVTKVGASLYLLWLALIALGILVGVVAGLAALAGLL